MTFVKSVIAWVLRLKVVRAYLLYSERRGAMLADSVTYRALFSVFAGLLLGFSVASIWLAGNPEAWKPIVAAIDSAIPGLVGEDGIVKDPTSIEPVGFTVTGIFSLVALVGAALGAIGSLRTAVRSIAGTVQDDVLFIWVILRNLALAAGIAVAFVAAAAVTFLARIGLSFITDLLGLPGDSVIAEWSIRVVSLLVVYALDVVLILGVFLLLSGLRAPAPAVWSGASLAASAPDPPGAVEPVRRRRDLEPAAGDVRLSRGAADLDEPVHAGDPHRVRLHHHGGRGSARPGLISGERADARPAPRAARPAGGHDRDSGAACSGGSGIRRTKRR
ncbi:YhjD/YihY/BrkB family envelope integrity protein [Microbacterium tenebrionis]|uniref:YhjD/YihY/BrkB family envelope integrity protein n=1 Tax=Microbacterium tenebrionis TaxID=2830665 RepID=UPI00202B06E0|nr:YhjD/YihY/BrkB family envelope integrity protein [Microbacterium ihumii]